MTADDLRELAVSMARACRERMARNARRDDETRRAHAALLARVDEAEREVREMREDTERMATLQACVMRIDAAIVEHDGDEAAYEPSLTWLAARVETALRETRTEIVARTAERDTLAAALAEVRERTAEFSTDCIAHRHAHARMDTVLSALPADLAAAHDREVEARALEEAARDADDPRACAPIPGHRQWAEWLRARAAEKRGAR